jgi:signal transduction histidine kinase/ligand-binding sensor domain-containing protein
MKYLLLIIPSILFFRGYCQPVTPQAELDYIIEEFTLPGGQVGNNVNSIVQGPYGFVWFGTHGGLHRYDGHEFVTYKNVPGDTLGETTSLTFPYVENLYWDHYNMLWVSTYGGGVYQFDPTTETFKHFPHNPKDSTSISNMAVTCAVEDASGQLWFGTTHGLNRYDRKTGKFKHYYANPKVSGSLHDDDIRSLYVDKQGALWAGTGFVLFGNSPGALSRYNPDTDSFTNYRYNPGGISSVRGLLEDSKGNFWVGTVNGLYKMNRQLGTFQHMTNDPTQPSAPGTNTTNFPATYSIYEDRKGGLWIGTIGDPSYPTHLLRYDTAVKKSQVFPTQSFAWQVFESTDGTFWIAGAGASGKIIKIKPKPKTYDLHRSIPFQQAFYNSELSKKVLATIVFSPANMAIDSASGHYWFQTSVASFDFNRATHEECVLADYDPKNNKLSYHHLEDIEIDSTGWSARGFFIDKEGLLWGSYGMPGKGIFNYDPSRRSVKQYLRDLPDSTARVRSVMMDSRGDIWAATRQHGLYQFNPKTEQIYAYHFNGMDFGENDSPEALMEAKDGKIWVGGNLMFEGVPFIAIIDPVSHTMKKLSTKVRQNPDFNFVTMSQSPVTGKVAFIYWYGGGSGLALYDPVQDQFDFVDRNSRLPFSHVNGLVCDKEGVFWIASGETNSILRFNELENDFDFQLSRSENASVSWGSGLLGPNGIVYFMTDNYGWLEIDPSKIKPEISSKTSGVRLLDLYLLGEKQKPKPKSLLPKPLWMLDELFLPSSAETFGFRFSGFDFQNSNAQFEYRLYPLETLWKKTGNTPVVNYYKVPSGEYRFEVRALNLGTANENSMASINVVVLPPWWKTWWAYGSYALIFIGGVFLTDRFQRRRLLAKATTAAKEKELVQAREIEKAYRELKATQSQLIQSEKMASLGELTAGIAHEIQNPLNFVNNFSEVSNELLDEMKTEFKKGDAEEGFAIADNIKQNLEKILHHGKRADAIVKGMLQHSRSSSGVKEVTDINALADEYLRLAYHGLRAKDKSFNATMKTEFDVSIGNINVVPQDIGRVILNLITNAFYAVNEKATLRKAQGDTHYEPTVSVSTRKDGDKVFISVKDNGNGIPQKVLDKIFQPFFTTKPTGQGTGLGLSLSYDIVKAHGGELKVETIEGIGSEFSIQLPIV